MELEDFMTEGEFVEAVGRGAIQPRGSWPYKTKRLGTGVVAVYGKGPNGPWDCLVHVTNGITDGIIQPWTHGQSPHPHVRNLVEPNPWKSKNQKEGRR